MKKTILFLFLFFFTSVCNAQYFGKSGFDIGGPTHAYQIWVTDPLNYFTTHASPPTVRSALYDLATGAVTGAYLLLNMSNSPLRAATDSTTRLQILDVDGGTPIFNVDTTNERIGIGTASPSVRLDVEVSSGGAATIGSSTNLATGDYAVAMGDGAWATGDYSLAMGDGTLASGVGSIGMGDGSGATGDYSIGIGLGSTAIGDYSIAVGRGSTADEDYTVAMGYGSTADGENAIAMGYGSTATGVSSVAIGEGNSVLDDYATGIGYYVTADGESSVALGFITTASGDYSTAMGDVTYANGEASTAMGSETEANGLVSTAMGKDINVDGDYSFGISLNDPVSDYEVVPNNVMAIMGGRVGIGIASPVQVLHVVGNILASNTASTAVVDTQYIENTAGGALTVRDDLIVTGTITDDDGLGYLKLDGSNADQDIDIGTYDLITSSPGYLEASQLRGIGGYTSILFYGEMYSTGMNDYPVAIQMNKSNSSTVGTMTTTVDDQQLGQITAKGTNTGNTFSTGSGIGFNQDGAAGATFIPADIVFFTTDTAGVTKNTTMDNAGDWDFGSGDIVTTGTASPAVVDTQYIEYTAGGPLTVRDDLLVRGDATVDTLNYITLNPAVAETDTLDTVCERGADFQNAVDSVTAFQIHDSDGGTSVINVDTDNERFGIGTDTPLAKLHIVDSTVSGIRLSSSEADDVAKYAIIYGTSYDTSAEPEGFVILQSTGGITANPIRIGGGNANRNAATELSFYTAADANTRTGTKRMRITSDGEVGIGTGDNDPTNTLQVAGLINFFDAIHGTFLGTDAGRLCASVAEDYCTFIGGVAGYKNDEGTYNVGIGYGALYENTSGDFNFGLGANALLSNTGGQSNVAMGLGALQNAAANHNVAIGTSSLREHLGNDYNVAIGTEALRVGTASVECVAIGGAAGYSDTSGVRNVAIGRHTCIFNETGDYNTIIGSRAAWGVSGKSFENSTMIGYGAGYAIETGSNNILIGYQAADNITTGGSNLIIGYDIDVQSATTSNQMSIGNLIFSEGVDGAGTTVSTGNVGIKTVSPLYDLHVTGDIFASDTASAAVVDTEYIEHTSGILKVRDDMVFTNSGTGLPFGCIEGLDETVTCTLEDTWYQVTFDTVGQSNLTTVDIANEEITILRAGVYQIAVTACFHSGVSHDWELIVKKNDGKTDVGVHLYQTTAVADKVENTTGSCLYSLSANDRIELWVQCTDAAGQDAIFDHVNLHCTQIGG